MTTLLMTVHVVAALVLLGPITVATSLFPRYGREALADPSGHASAYGLVRAMHRITVGYSVAAIAVPVFGLATALAEHVLGQAWLLAAMGLTVIAAALLAGVVIPAQRRVLAGLDSRAQPGSGDRSVVISAGLAKLTMTAGLFALTWVTVAVLMVTQPGGAGS